MVLHIDEVYKLDGNQKEQCECHNLSGVGLKSMGNVHPDRCACGVVNSQGAHRWVLVGTVESNSMDVQNRHLTPRCKKIKSNNARHNSLYQPNAAAECHKE
ncbi:Uncharacterized protein Fot_52484 [Forsythia ovata]|uniref:Uncharacterized protein n=1 Tax=Forsythia ovata TaxID=205694 RepID=A0ABD1PME1_9LAMI